MQRKPGPGPGAPPPAACAIKPPDSVSLLELPTDEQDRELHHQRRQQLINFGHSQWGFNNWSWAVTKQELDFVDFFNGKYSVGVVAFVTITVRSLEISREDIGYATTVAPQKGSAIFQARKCAVTNALRETLLSFGGNVAAKLLELLESQKTEVHGKTSQIAPELLQENNNIANKLQNPLPTTKIEPPKLIEPKNACINNRTVRTDSLDSGKSRETSVTFNNNPRPPHQNILPQPPIKTMPMAGAAVAPVAKAQPIPANHVPPIVNKPDKFPANHMHPKPHNPPPITPANVTGPPLSHVRPNSNVSFVLQPVMPGLMPQLYAPSPNRMPAAVPQHMFPNAYYAEYAPWHFTYEGYERQHGNVNLNFSIPPKNVVVNNRSGTIECKSSYGPGRALHMQHQHMDQDPAVYANHHNNPASCWIKPSIFYDGFWTEQKVKKWVAAQVEKEFPDDRSHKSVSPGNNPH